LRKLFLSPFSFSDIQMNVLVVGMGGAWMKKCSLFGSLMYSSSRW
jgi:hypothetical protein